MRNHNKKKTLKISLSVSTWILKNWKIIPSLTQNERTNSDIRYRSPRQRVLSSRQRSRGGRERMTTITFNRSEKHSNRFTSTLSSLSTSRSKFPLQRNYCDFSEISGANVVRINRDLNTLSQLSSSRASQLRQCGSSELCATVD